MHEKLTLEVEESTYEDRDSLIEVCFNTVGKETVVSKCVLIL